MNIKRTLQGVLLSFIFISILGGLIYSQQFFWKILKSSQNFSASILGAPNTEIKPQKRPAASELELTAGSAISVWTDLSGKEEVLYGKNELIKRPVASLTKLMTALVVLENYDLSKNVIISTQAEQLESKRPERILAAGKGFSAESLLNLMLIESNSSAAYALSEVLGEAEFAAKMNLKAAEIGLNDTVFSNAVGRGMTNFSTAKDVAKLLDYIYINNPEILQISAKKSYDLYDFEKVFQRKINNINELLNDQEIQGRVIGGKTGETAEAGQCLAVVARTEDNKSYLLNVVLGSTQRFEDMKNVILWVDASYLWPGATSLNEDIFIPEKLSWVNAVSDAPWGKRDSHSVVVFKNKMWLMGGLDASQQLIEPGVVEYTKAPHFNDVWLSQDGIDWRLVTDNAAWGKRRSIQVVAFKDKMWLMGGWSPTSGYKNDIWSSEDGVNWKEEITSAAWPAREGHQVEIFNNKMWLAGGVRYDTRELFNDVWYSEDGINWIKAIKNAEWSPRWDHTLAVFKNKLWLTGGMVFGGEMFREVWYSDDGANWKMVTNSLPFTARQGNFSTEYKGNLWIVGRLDGDLNGGANDVWYSDNGFDWKKTQNDPAWFGREDFSAAVFNGKIWILGGMDKNWSWKSDVWYSNY